MYHKDLDRNKILTAAVALMMNDGPSVVSFRSVARSIGCAHTNIYNFFKDSDSLFRACGVSILLKLEEKLVETRNVKTKAGRLKAFYKACAQFYIEHPGWFQLIWTYPIQMKDSVESRKILQDTIGQYVQHLVENLDHCTHASEAHHLLHIVHAYMLGEVSIYFAGKSLFPDEKSLISYVVEHCLLLTELLDTEKTKQLPHFLVN